MGVKMSPILHFLTPLEAAFISLICVTAVHAVPSVRYSERMVGAAARFQRTTPEPVGVPARAMKFGISETKRKQQSPRSCAFESNSAPT
eukprot:COSAG02_NODE_3967_length_5975_cov_20.818244_4_plen_89_part_00